MPPKPPAPSLIAKVDLTTQTMTVITNGNTSYTWKVSSGGAGYATPTGTFKPDWMAKMWYSKQYDDAPMPHSVFFKNGAAIHGTTSTGRLGTASVCVDAAPGILPGRVAALAGESCSNSRWQVCCRHAGNGPS